MTDPIFSPETELHVLKTKQAEQQASIANIFLIICGVFLSVFGIIVTLFFLFL